MLDIGREERIIDGLFGTGPDTSGTIGKKVVLITDASYFAEGSTATVFCVDASGDCWAYQDSEVNCIGRLGEVFKLAEE